MKTNVSTTFLKCRSTWMKCQKCTVRASCNFGDSFVMMTDHRWSTPLKNIDNSDANTKNWQFQEQYSTPDHPIAKRTNDVNSCFFDFIIYFWIPNNRKFGIPWSSGGVFIWVLLLQIVMVRFAISDIHVRYLLQCLRWLHTVSWKAENTFFRPKISYIDILLEEWN